MSNIIKTETYKGFNINFYYSDYAESPRDWDNVATLACTHGRYDLGDDVDFNSELSRLLYKYVSLKDLSDHFLKLKNARIETNEDGDEEYCWIEKWRDGSMHECNIRFDDEDEKYEWLSDDLDVMQKIELISLSDDIVINTISIYDHSGISIWPGTPEGHVDARWDCSIVGIAFIEKSTAEKWGAMKSNEYKSWRDWASQTLKNEMRVYDDYVRGETYMFEIEGIDEEMCGDWYGSEGLKEGLEKAKDLIDYHIKWESDLRSKNLSKLNENLSLMVGCTFIEDDSIFKVVTTAKNEVEIVKGVAVNGVIGLNSYRDCPTEELSNYLLKNIAEYIDKTNGK